MADFFVVGERNSFLLPAPSLTPLSFSLIAIVYALKCITLIYDSSSNYPSYFLLLDYNIWFCGASVFIVRFSLKTSLVTAPFKWLLYVISLEILPCALIIASFASMIFHVGKHDRSARS